MRCSYRANQVRAYVYLCYKIFCICPKNAMTYQQIRYWLHILPGIRNEAKVLQEKYAQISMASKLDVFKFTLNYGINYRIETLSIKLQNCKFLQIIFE